MMRSIAAALFCALAGAASASGSSAPLKLYFDEVAGDSLVAAVYSPYVPGAGKDGSAVSVSVNGRYLKWRKGDVWTSKAQMPAPTNALAAGVIGGKLYAVGGYAMGVYPETGILTVNQEYDPVADVWTTKASLPSVRRYCSAGVINGKLYVVGGTNGYSEYGLNEEYDPAADAWRTRAPMPTPRHSAAAGVIAGKLYVAGGHDGTAVAAANEVYDPASDSWAVKAPMPAPRYASGFAAAGDKLYVIGGLSGNSSVVSAANEAYDPRADKWARLKDLPEPRNHLASAGVGGKVLALGGYSAPDGSGTNTAAVDEYDPGSDSWRGKAPMPTARREFAAAVLRGLVYAVGGWGDRSLRVNEAYDPGNTFFIDGLKPGGCYRFGAKARGGEGALLASLAPVRLCTPRTAAVKAAPPRSAPPPAAPAAQEPLKPAAPPPSFQAAPAPAAAQAARPERKKSGRENIAVAEFVGKNVSQADASIVGDFLRTGLVGAGRFAVMERSNMDVVLAEQKFQNSGCTEQQCAVEMGRVLNVDKMIVGSLSKLLGAYYVSVNVVNVETGEITASYDSEAGDARGLKRACQKLAERISEKQ